MSYQYDHRILADEMEIYFLDEQIGAGLPVWLPNGVAIRDALEAFVKRLEDEAGFQRVVSPHVAKAELFDRSGHLRAFGGNMFPPMKDGESELYLKPMNCPFHHRVFSSSPRSYRQLPLRLAEYGQVYRYEDSGALKGLSRVRALCQNDAHIYVDPRDAISEIGKVLEMHEHCYRALGLEGYRYRLSKHDPARMEDFDGSREQWLEAEEILRRGLEEKGLPYFEADGEAAFYGPKVDVQMRMGAGDEESIASVQLDFNSAEKFELSFVDSSGECVRPWIVHRAPLGSHERFVALLLEYFDGQLPAWLAPVQVLLVPVGPEQVNRCRELARELGSSGVRAKIDVNAGSLSKRILFAHKLRPFAKVIVGERESKADVFVVESRGSRNEVRGDALVGEMKKAVAPPLVKREL
ncbi:MAG: threonine--tRNA ligase [Bdellovibrionota bacterium]